MTIVRMTSEEIRKKYPLTPERLARMRAIKDEDIDYSDNPEWTDEQLEQAVRERAERLGRPALPPEEKKVGTYIRFSPHVLAKLRASGKNWQTRLSKKVEELVAAGVL